MDEVADCGSSDDGLEAVPDQIGMRYEYLKAELEAAGKQSTPKKGKPQESDESADEGSSSRKVPRRSGTVTSPKATSPGEEDLIAHTPRRGASSAGGGKGDGKGGKGGAGRPKKDIFKIQQDMTAEFNVAKENSNFFDANVSAVQSKLVKRHIVTCSSRLINAAPSEKVELVIVRKKLQVIESVMDLYTGWRDKKDVAEAANKFMAGWQQLIAFCKQDPQAPVKCEFIEELALSIHCMYAPDRDLATALSDSVLSESFPSKNPLDLRKKMALQAVQTHLMRSRPLLETLTILTGITSSLLKLNMPEAFSQELQDFQLLISPPSSPGKELKDGSHLLGVVERCHAKDHTRLQLLVICPLHGVSILKNAQCAAAKQTQQCILARRVISWATESARLDSTFLTKGADFKTCDAIGEATACLKNLASLAEDDYRMCTACIPEQLQELESITWSLVHVAFDKVFESWARWSSACLREDRFGMLHNFVFPNASRCGRHCMPRQTPPHQSHPASCP